MQHYWRVWLAAACVKVLLFPSYYSTDYDVHRNWLAITHSRDASKWYADQPLQNQWTLDYPPLFAMYEAILSKIAARVDMKIVDESERDYASVACIRFQRATVVITELASLGVAVRAATAGDAKSALAFAGSGALLLVDHVHFQYNGLLLGVLVYALFMLRRGDHVKAGALFALLCCAKHLFLTLAPVLAAVFVAAHVRPRQDFVKAFLELAGASSSGARFGFGAPLHPSLARGAPRKCNDGARGPPLPLRRARPRAQLLGAERLGFVCLRRPRPAEGVEEERGRRRDAGLGGDGRRGAARARPEGLRAPDGPRGPAGGLRRGARASNAAAARRLTYPCAAHAALAAFCFGWCPRPLPCLPFASTARHTARASRRWRMGGARRHRRDIHPGTRHRRVPRA